MKAKQESARRFNDLFGSRPEIACRSPGRINLIGEHTDYHGGWVLPVAINLGTTLIVAPNNEQRIRLFSSALAKGTEISVKTLERRKPSGDWSDYIIGIAVAMQPFSTACSGIDLLIDSDLPRGAGLSSSASLTVGAAYLFNRAWKCGRSHDDLIDLAQQAENDYVGVSCGILDPFAVCHGRADHAIALRCADRHWRHVNFPAEACRLVVLPSGIVRELKNSAYNSRRKESEAALEKVQGNSTCGYRYELTEDDLASLQSDHTLLSRARHFVAENGRVAKAINALETGNLVEFGKLMTASHYSLRDDYEVSCPQLDGIVDAATRHAACFGAKMTGAGFGGAVVACVETAGSRAFVAHMEAANVLGDGTSAIVCSIADGVREISLS